MIGRTIAQINNQHSILAKDELNVRKSDIELVTEPYVRDKQAAGYKIKGARVYTEGNSPRALIRIRNASINVMYAAQYSSTSLLKFLDLTRAYYL